MQSSRKWILGVLLALTVLLFVDFNAGGTVRAQPIKLTLEPNQNLLTNQAPTQSLKTLSQQTGDKAGRDSVFTDNGGSGTMGTCAWNIDDQGVLHIGAGTLGDTTSFADGYGNPFSPWQSYAYKITQVTFDGPVKTSSQARGMFYSFQNVTRYNNISNLDLSNATDISNMFGFNLALTSLDVAGWNISKVTTLNSLFAGCRAVNALDVSKWDTSNVIDMRSVFTQCYQVQSLDTSGWKTNKVTNMHGMFALCSNLRSVKTTTNGDIWNTNKVTDMGYMFSACPQLNSVDTSGWDVGNVKDMSYMFQQNSSLVTLDVANWKPKSVTTFAYMFTGCSSLTTLDVVNWDVSRATMMNSMFSGCSQINNLDVSAWNVGSVRQMSSLFSYCYALTALDVSKWNTVSVNSMDNVFYGDKSLKQLDVTNWNTSNARTIDYLFTGCTSLTNINVTGPNWKTDNVTSMAGVFQNCSGLSKIDVSTWNTKKVQWMQFMFQNCTGLSSIDIANFDMSSITTDKNGSGYTGLQYTLAGMGSNLRKLVLGNGNNLLGSNNTGLSEPTVAGSGKYWRAVNVTAGGTESNPKGAKAYTSNALMAAFPLNHAASLNDTYVLYDDKGGITAHSSHLIVGDPAWQPMDNIDSITDSEGQPVTDLSNVSVQIKDASGNSVSTVDTSTPGSYTVTYVYTDEVGIVHYVNGSSSASSVTVTVDPLIALNFIPTSWDFGQHPKGPSVLGLAKVNGGENVKDNQLRMVANGSAWQVNVKYDEFTADKTADYAGDQLKNTSLRFANVELDDAKGNNVGGVNNNPTTGDVRIAGGNDYANVVNMANVPADEKGNFTLQLGKQLSDTTLSVPELPNTNTAKDAPDYTQYHSTIYWQLVNSVR